MAVLTLRNIKGNALTFDELDSNFLALDSDITVINNTLSAGVGLGADSVNSLIDTRIDSDGFVRLTTNQTITGNKTFSNDVNVGLGTSTELLTVKGGSDGVVIGGTGTIAGTTWTNGTFHLGDSVSGWAMDRNEFYNGGAAIIGTLDGTLTLSPNTVTTTSRQFQSSVSTGTAPFIISSTTLVTNLNADKVDGYNGIAVFDRAGTLLN